MLMFTNFNDHRLVMLAVYFTNRIDAVPARHFPLSFIEMASYRTSQMVSNFTEKLQDLLSGICGNGLNGLAYLVSYFMITPNNNIAIYWTARIYLNANAIFWRKKQSVVPTHFRMEQSLPGLQNDSTFAFSFYELFVSAKIREHYAQSLLINHFFFHKLHFNIWTLVPWITEEST